MCYLSYSTATIVLQLQIERERRLMGIQIQYSGGTKDDPTPVWTKMKYNLHTSTVHTRQTVFLGVC